MSKSINATQGQKIQFDTADSSAKTSEPSIALALAEAPREKSPATIPATPANEFSFAWSRMSLGGIREGDYTEF